MSAAFEARILALAAEQAAKQGPIDYEIGADGTSRWHILQTWPQHETVAAAHLIARRFGVYLPFFKVRWKDRFGNWLTREKKLFPGYLFLFCQDVMRNQRRIEAVPGIGEIVMFAGQPAVVPDALIGQMQVREVQQEQQLTKPKRRRNRIDVEPQAIKIWTKGLEELDDGARNLVLRKALGLA